MKERQLYIVSGPSGAGKSSLCQALLCHCPDMRLAVSCTTRSPRVGEVAGESYHFLDQATFDQAVKAGKFLEWAHVHGCTYGTRYQDVIDTLNAGQDVLLEIDWQGAALVAKAMPAAVRIFILPPDIATLGERLQNRGQDDEHVIKRRLAAAEEEMSHANEAQHVLINIDFDQTLQQLLAIVQQSCGGSH